MLVVLSLQIHDQKAACRIYFQLEGEYFFVGLSYKLLTSLRSQCKTDTTHVYPIFLLR